ncbi:MAG: hypothetical protein H3C62_02025, partial [Gemmatimonadaceae bacterium]|nr:hypothetical protein [Gemmatimonadaceae bacterium]
MARGPSHLGIDLNSIALAGVVLHERASSRGTEFVIEQSWADEIGAIAHIGGTWLLPPVWPEALRVSTAATILGILDASESVTLAAMDYSDGREAVRQANNLAEQIQNVSK